ncbi:MAG: hypothetical protein ACD_33C00023G0003 [uncultured bacterium]|nr:MAG: hypothetical protein ACD_33C00023G0003 [uncultured bacterium]
MSALFSPEDQRLLDKTTNVRERIIDNLIKAELPTKASDIMAITSLLESLDKTILSKAKLKIEDTNSKTNEEVKETMKELLLNLHKSVNKKPHEHSPERIAALPTDIVYAFNDHEMVKHTDEVSIKDFT